MTEPVSRLGAVLAGKWTLEALLGEGGHGAVYRARHKNGSKVAVKVLSPERARDPLWTSRFEREALLANKVEHPAVVRFFDGGRTDDGAPFLVSELVEGETLEEARAEAGGTLPLGEVLAWIDALLDVLTVAHESGVVHRDLKPSNLMRAADGSLKVLDFGLGRDTGESAPDATSVGAILGTVGFMAPEQAQGRWDLVDATTDLWAVAATFLKLAAGLDVHEADTPAMRLALAATTPAPRIAARTPAIPEPIARVLDRALAFSKMDRYTDATSLRGALARAARGDRDEQQEPREPQERRRGSLVGAVVSTVTIAAAALAWLASRGHHEAAPGVDRTTAAPETVELAADADATSPSPAPPVLPPTPRPADGAPAKPASASSSPAAKVRTRSQVDPRPSVTDAATDEPVLAPLDRRR